MSTQIKVRRDTAANWSSSDPTPAQGEICLETDTGKGKIGDGATAWTSLEYSIVVDPVPATAGSLDRPVLSSPQENCQVSATAATGTVQVDLTTAAVWYYTASASANWTFNFRGDASTSLDSLLAVGDSVSVVFLVTQGATPYYPTAFTVDGSAVTPKWSGGAAPAAGNASAVDAYSFTIIKTGSGAFTVLAGAGSFA